MGTHNSFFTDKTPVNIPVELLYSLNESPTAYQTFESFIESLQPGIIDWIYCAKDVESLHERILKTIIRLTNNGF